MYLSFKHGKIINEMTRLCASHIVFIRLSNLLIFVFASEYSHTVYNVCYERIVDFEWTKVSLRVAVADDIRTPGHEKTFWKGTFFHHPQGHGQDFTVHSRINPITERK